MIRAVLLASLLACAPVAMAVPEMAPAQIALGDGDMLEVVGDWTLLAPGSDGARTRGTRLTRHGAGLDKVWIIEGLRPGQAIVEASFDTRDGPKLSDARPFGETQAAMLLAGSYTALNWMASGTVDVSALPPSHAFEIQVRADLTDALGNARVTRALARQGEDGRVDLIIIAAEASLYWPRIEADALAMLAALQ